MLPPPNLTKSLALYKFLYLENFGGGHFKLYRAWGARKKITLYTIYTMYTIYTIYIIYNRVILAIY